MERRLSELPIATSSLCLAIHRSASAAVANPGHRGGRHAEDRDFDPERAVQLRDQPVGRTAVGMRLYHGVDMVGAAGGCTGWISADQAKPSARSASTGYAAKVPFLIQMVDDDPVRLYHR